MISRRVVIFYLAGALLLVGLVKGGLMAYAASTTNSCQSYQIPVALNQGEAAHYTIYGELCNPAAGPSHTVQLLLSGVTYGHIYWDFSYQPSTYSYVQALNRAGYSTLNIDRIGIGKSSHPLGALVTKESNAYIAHELVQDLLSGQIGAQSFARVVLVGHSYGSLIAWNEAALYHDVAGVIITGLTHHINAVSFGGFVASLHPAASDPRFQGTTLDPDYLTTQPGSREKNFYYQSNVDPQVVQTDEATKETLTSGEIATGLGDLVLGMIDKLDIAQQIKVPVLLAVGQDDILVCGIAATNCSSDATLLQSEASYYAPEAQLEAKVIPNAGHDINLHKNAPTWFQLSASWTGQHFAP